MRKHKARTMALCVGIYTLGAGRHALALSPTGIEAEGVCDYSVEGDSHADFCTDSNGFFTTMTASGTGWTQIHNWQDNDVWDSDFMDPDVSGALAGDDDTDNADKSGTAITYIALHGACNDAKATPCTTAANCASGQVCGPTIPNAASSSACIANSSRLLVTSSTDDIHNHDITYSTGKAKWGEDLETGSWAGAGTNGGTNCVFVDNSCGVRSPFWWSQTEPAFAGTALINFVMPTSNTVNAGSSDYAQYSLRGEFLANYALANPNGTANNGWFYVEDTIRPDFGSGCPNLDSDFSYGGGHGILGCGAHISIAYDSSAAAAHYDIYSLTWLNLRNDTYESHGNSNGLARWHCNYNCDAYGLNK